MKSCEAVLLIAGLTGLRTVPALSAQEARTISAEEARIRTTISATIDVLLEDLLELRTINEMSSPKVRGNEWKNRLSAIDSGLAVVAAQILALNSLDRVSSSAHGWRVATELQGSARQMQRVYSGLTRESDAHSTRRTIIHLVAILEVMREATGGPTQCCARKDSVFAKPRI